MHNRCGPVEELCSLELSLESVDGEDQREKEQLCRNEDMGHEGDFEAERKRAVSQNS